MSESAYWDVAPPDLSMREAGELCARREFIDPFEVEEAKDLLRNAGYYVAPFNRVLRVGAQHVLNGYAVQCDESRVVESVKCTLGYQIGVELFKQRAIKWEGPVKVTDEHYFDARAIRGEARVILPLPPRDDHRRSLPDRAAAVG